MLKHAMKLALALAGAILGGYTTFALALAIASQANGFGDQFGGWLLVCALIGLVAGAPVGALAMVNGNRKVRLGAVVLTIGWMVFVAFLKIRDTLRPRPAEPSSLHRASTSNRPAADPTLHQNRINAIRSGNRPGRERALGWIDSRIPTKEDSRHRGPLVELLFGIAENPWPDAAPHLVALDQRSQQHGDILGRLPLVPLAVIDTPAARDYLKTVERDPRRRSQVKLARNRAAIWLKQPPTSRSAGAKPKPNQ